VSVVRGERAWTRTRAWMRLTGLTLPPALLARADHIIDE
jgi:hypothetical protein